MGPIQCRVLHFEKYDWKQDTNPSYMVKQLNATFKYCKYNLEVKKYNYYIHCINV